MGILVCGNPVPAGGLSVSWLLLILFTVPSPLSVRDAICQSAQGGCLGASSAYCASASMLCTSPVFPRRGQPASIRGVGGRTPQ